MRYAETSLQMVVHGRVWAQPDRGMAEAVDDSGRPSGAGR
jgi:hypothetical protein